MPRIDPEGQLTRKERLVSVIAVICAVLIHLIALFGWGRIYRWTQEEQKKERLMVIRRIREISPPLERPAEPRQRPAPVGTEGKVGGEKSAPPTPPEPKLREPGPDPPPEPELTPAMEQEIQERPPEPSRIAEHGENTVSVVTDLPAASFIVGGPAEFRGSGTFWVRKGAPPGEYTATFNPVPGFATPPVQTKVLVAKGRIVFVGKYRRSTELVVESNMPGAQFTVFRPDGRPIDLSRPGRLLLDDLPPGTYTAVFKDLPGRLTPAPQTRSLVAGGKLSFYGEYREASVGSGGSGGRAGADGVGTGAKGAGAGGGAGFGRGSKGAVGSREPGLDRRVQMIVKSYPRTEIEEYHDAIPYPELIIRRSNFQQGWCQVYLVLEIDDRGEIRSVVVERPRPGDRASFEALIAAVEKSVRSWEYDNLASEVHVDVRFYVE